MRLHVLLFAALAALSPHAHSQSKKDARMAAINKAITSGSYIFNIQNVSSSASGAPGSLSSAYFFKVTPDSVYSDMPYFGSSRFPGKTITQSPLLFTSANFDYAVNPKPKGGWNIIIRFKDVQEIQGVSISVGKDGYGTLQVTPVDLQSISFSGNITK